MDLKSVKDGILALPKAEKDALWASMKELYELKRGCLMRREIEQRKKGRQLVIIKQTQETDALKAALTKYTGLKIEIVESGKIVSN